MAKHDLPRMSATRRYDLEPAPGKKDGCKCEICGTVFLWRTKVKNYKSAFEPWMKVRGECPSINVAIYSYGERILKDRIKNGSPEEQEASKKDILKLYDQWVENFPKKRNNTLKAHNQNTETRHTRKTQ